MRYFYALRNGNAPGYRRFLAPRHVRRLRRRARLPRVSAASLLVATCSAIRVTYPGTTSQSQQRVAFVVACSDAWAMPVSELPRIKAHARRCGRDSSNCYLWCVARRKCRRPSTPNPQRAEWAPGLCVAVCANHCAFTVTPEGPLLRTRWRHARCKECGGSQICAHGRRQSTCNPHRAPASCARSPHCWP